MVISGAMAIIATIVCILVILAGLAILAASTIGLPWILKKPIKTLNIVGGGSKNVLLNKFTAEAIKRPVITGPSEGTVIGNLLMQAVTLGEIEDIWALRRVVEASFPTEEYLPQTDGKDWDEAYARYLKLFG